MSTNNNVMVSIDHLYKSYGPEMAVKDFNIEIEQGEFVTLLGPSGCGKTTTLRCVAGLERPEAGEIRIGEHHGRCAGKGNLPLSRAPQYRYGVPELCGLAAYDGV